VVTLDPPTPSATDVVRARIEAPASDPDGDPLVYRYRWKVDGQVRNVPLFMSALQPGLFRKHQKIEVEVRAFDGQLEGPPVTVSVVAKNTAPSAPKVAILPVRPRHGQALRASIAEPSADPDRDAVTYRFAWSKNGQPYHAPGEGREIPATDVARTDRFEVVVTPGDGEANGAVGTATTSVVNTPPIPPRIAIEPRHPKGGETLKLVVVEPARDVDGERVTLSIAWTHEGKPTGLATETLPPSAYRKHERVRVIVTPRDGQDAGAPAMDEVRVEDAAPTAPVVAFGSERPVVTKPLEVVVKTPATDADGDSLEYRYRWLRNGQPVALKDGTEASTAPPYWTAIAKVPANLLKKGEQWTVEARAGDGELHGPTARATVTIANSPPPAPNLLFSPERPRRVDGIALSIQQPPDADGDPVSYRYTWFRNGERYEAPPDQAQIPRNVAKKGQRWSVEVVASDGEAESPSVKHEMTIADTAPGPTAVGMCDGPVPSGTVPQARITLAAVDPDGDPVTYRHEWTVNGQAVPSASGQARLASPALKKHDRVQVVVTPFDGDLPGPSATATCEVANTPPTAPVVALEPAEATATSGVSVVVRKPSADRDGDAVSYRYEWTRDGVPMPQEGATIAPGVLRNGERWGVVVTPLDGESEGEPVVLSAIVKNTPPVPPAVALRPATAAAREAIGCETRAPERDADQEPISVRYEWSRNDRPEPIADGLAQLPAGVVRRGEKWRCDAWTTDGVAESRRVSAELVVRNSPPGAPVVDIEPEKPRKGNDLDCRISTAALDADGDAVTYSYQWAKNGQAQPAGPDPSRIEASRTAKGERWRCTATPSDGTATGAPASQERVVANTPPGAAMVRLQPATPLNGQPLRCEVSEKSEDADGDAVRYRFGWERNGAAQPFAESSQEVPARLVKTGDRWRCTVTPTDGTDSGPTAGTEESLVVSGADVTAGR
jgi:hypothetical protein